jgi:hypothetical protein
MAIIINFTMNTLTTVAEWGLEKEKIDFIPTEDKAQ